MDVLEYPKPVGSSVELKHDIVKAAKTIIDNAVVREPKL
jgi:hypothetical protein